MEATTIVLTVEERSTLEKWVRATTTERRLVERARIVLRAADCQGTREIGRVLGVMPATVSRWRVRFARDRLAGLQDAPRSGRRKTYTAKDERRVLEALDEDPPDGFATWTARLIEKKLGVSKHYIWRVLKAHKIHLQRRKSWCVSTDPEFQSKAADIVGLYLDTPENAVVLCVDEKPSIQALERKQGYLKLPNGRALAGFGHEYKRHGTTTLFAALEVATGLVKARHFKRRRRREFLAFMNDLVAAYPNQELHVILDNLNTHKPKTDRWLAQHKNVHFHYTPTRASWLNLVECWFSILSRRAIKGASFTSPQAVRRAIDAFIKAHNKEAAPFIWTKPNVHPAPLRKRYSDLRN